MKSKAGQILIHVFGCLMFLSFPILFSPDLGKEEMIHIPTFQKDFLNYFFLIAAFYFAYYFLVPEFYFKKKYFLFILLAIGIYLVVAFLPDLIVPEHQRPPPAGKPVHFRPAHFRSHYVMVIGHTFFRFLIVVVFALTLRIINRWKQAESD